MSTKTNTAINKEAFDLLTADAYKIINLIEVQLNNLTMPKCPLYEEVLDTQMFGLSREIDFAVRLSLIREEDGKQLLDNVEKKLSALYEERSTSMKDSQQNHRKNMKKHKR